LAGLGLQRGAKSRRLFGSEMLPGFLDELWTHDIHTNQSSLRDDLGPMEGLIFSIKEKGLLQPIVVRPVENAFEVIAGNRRLEACKRLRVKNVPCYIVGRDDKQAYEVSLIENIQRKTLNPIEEAKAFRRYVDERGYGAVSELAARIGKSEPYVSKRLALLELPIQVQEQLVRRRITPSTAEEFISLDSDEIDEVSRHLAADKPTRVQVRAAIKILRESGFTKYPGIQYPEQEESVRRIERARSKCIASMGACLMQIDDAIDSLGENEWFVKENLMVYRRSIHHLIDNIVSMRRQKQLTTDLVRESQLKKSS
jgi:ParB family chromosome partitioning protein